MITAYLNKSRFILFAILCAAVILPLTAGGAASAATGRFPAKVGYPNSIASTGDSTTRAFNTGATPFTDAPQNSWSTGTSSSVKSHYQRILAANGQITGNTYNDAITGDQMSGLNGEIASAVAQHVDYVTVLMSANDACTDTVDGMTPVSTYRSEFETAMQTFSSGLPDSRIYVVSVPNVYTLWSILHNNLLADSTWSLLNICQSMLANPRSMATPDIQRRQTVLQRETDYNTQLQQVCAEYIHCRFDNNAIFNYTFTPKDISTRDYFHPNIKGQGLLASVSYGAGFDFTDQIAPHSTAQTTPFSDGISVSLKATDKKGVAGIKYMINSGSWVRYSGPVFVASGSSITYRAVDVNGNIEASHTIVSP